ncbi:MAG: LysR family transcriptional regulator [Gammaproteobacteria bacterium]|jgi:LysR family transcriptional regulator, transcriptional activator of the cysJI operon|nr:LysR family transcriptional regulator [Gammaproteobacteria bacterium]MBT7603076.1 LysR family transcriptional regulator [Gammaproteobacteria bacterium]
MSDRRLQVFYTVAKLLSFTKAAETLHMTQPAVTFQVRQLEDHFDTRLFDRTHNKILLTDAGHKVFFYAEKIFELNAEMEHSIRALSEDTSGTLSIGGSTTIAQYTLPLLLKGFREKYPDLSIKICEANTDGIVAKVESSVIDLGIVEAPVTNQDLDIDVFRSDELVLIVHPNHKLAKKDSVKPSEILGLSFITREDGSGTKSVIFDYFTKNNIDKSSLNVFMELGNSESIKGAVEAGIGVSILSKTTIDKELQLNRLSFVRLAPKLTRNFYFVKKRHKFRLKVTEELINYAKSCN